MTSHPTQVKLKALPMQLIQTADGVILKRGCTEFKISGEGVAETLKLVLDVTANGGATLVEICKQFDPQSYPVVEQLIGQLLARRLVVPRDAKEPESDRPESSLDVFYWHFDERAARVAERLNKQHFVILGVNLISRQLVSSFLVSGVENFLVMDHPLLRNLRLFDDAGKLKRGLWPTTLKAPQECTDDLDPKSLDCLVATSDFGQSPLLREWNKYCIEHNRHYLPVVLQNLIGYVGPLVVPGETACFECLLARQNSHLEDPQAHRAVEDMAFEGQRTIGFHPSMASILGDVAAFELTKFYDGMLKGKVGTLIEVDMLATRLTARRVLKIPRCMVCSPLHRQPSMTPKKNMFTPIKKANK